MEMVFGSAHDVTIAQECARAVLVFFYGLVMLRLSGRRTFAQWSALDVAMLIIVGSALSRTITAAAPLAGTLVAIGVLVVLHLGLSYAIARYDWLSHIVEGRSVALARHGHLDEALRVKHKISKSDVAEALRGEGFTGLDALAQVIGLELEPSGKISVIRK